MRRIGPPMLALLVAGLVPAVGEAQAVIRAAVVVDATVDGDADPSAAEALEALLSDRLAGAGVRLVDPEMARRVRAFVEAPAAVDGRLPAGVSTLDADWVLAARADCRTREERGMMDRVRRRAGTDTVLLSTNCTATISLVRTDTAEVAGRQSLSGAGAAAYPHEAVRRALERIAADLGRRHLEGLLARARAERPVGIWLFAPPDRRAAERLRAALTAAEGTSDVTVVSVDDAMARLEARHPGGGLALAAALEADGDLDVRVERATAGLLTLRWDPSAALSTRIHVRPFRDATGEARLSTRAAIVPGRLAALMAASPYLVPVDDPDAADLVVDGEVRRNRRGALEVAVEVSRGGHRVMASRSAAADPEAELAGTLASGLPGALARHAQARREDAWAKRFGDADARLASVAASRRLMVGEATVADVFPALLAAAAEARLGHVNVRPAGSGPVEVVVRAQVVGLSAGPRLSAPMVVRAGTDTPIPLDVTFDPDRLLSRTTASGGQLQVELLWREGGAERSETFVVPVRIHERNAIDWREGETAVAFVTPRDPAIRSLVGRALEGAASAPADLPPEVVRAARIVETLRARGLAYVPDPVVPFGERDLDVVRFPGESLAAGQGDCSDLSVLLASALEAAGIRTFLVTTPGHLLVAYDSGLPPVLAGGLGAVLDAGGRALVPIEATALGRGYAEAVAAGGEVVGRRPEAVGLIAVRDGWRKTPPAPPPVVDGIPPAVAAEGVDGIVAALAESRRAATAAAVTEAEAQVAAAPGSAPARLSLARALVAAGRSADARRILEAAPAAGEDAAWWLTEANVLAVDGVLETAAERLETALERTPAGPPRTAALRNLSIVRLAAGDEAGAVDALTRALAADGDVMTDLGVEGLALARASGSGDGERVLDGDLARLLAEARRRVAERGGEAGDGEAGGDGEGPQIISGGRRGDDPEARRALAAVLVWPDPAGGGASAPR